MKSNQPLIDILKEAINTRAGQAESADEELLESFKTELVSLEKARNLSVSDETLDAYANALYIAIKAVIQIKEAMLAGSELSAADISAVVTANDLEQEIADQYF